MVHHPEISRLADGEPLPAAQTTQPRSFRAGWSPETIPPQLGPYRLARLLGTGGMGMVYEGFSEDRGTRVALKILPNTDPAALVSFKNEYRSMANIAHPNLATLYELMVIEDIWFLTMELVDGVEFLSYIWGDTPLRDEEGLPLDVESRLRSALKQLARGVQALHAAGLLHLDLKGGNVLVEDNGRLVILDFGLVQSFERAPPSAGDRAGLRGTPLYVSPEQVLGADATEASDWYAVGVMLFQALTCADPFNGSGWDVLLARTREPAPHPCSVRPGLPADLAELCSLLLLQDPAARPRGDEVLRRLDAAPAGQHAVEWGPKPRVLVGRSAELDAMMEAYRTAGEGRPLCLCIKGLSGMGKSALLHDFVAAIEARESVFLLTGRCYERESVPYKGLDAVMDALCRTLASLPSSVERLILGEEAHHAARIFPTLGSLELLQTIPDNTKGSLDPQEQRRLAFLGVKRILRRLCEKRRVVVLIDDLHWGDVDSARLLFELLSPPGPPPLLLVAAYRSDEAEQSPFFRELRSLVAHPNLFCEQREIEVGPLDEEDATRLAAIHMGADARRERARAVASEAAGIPFFIKEMARHAASAGEGQAVPPLSLNQLIESRLDHMPHEARRLLRLVAVAGRPVEQAVVLEAAQVAEGSQATLALLRSAHLVRTRGIRGTDPVETYHDRIRESVTTSLSKATLSNIHQHLALTLEASQRAQPDVLAYHFHGAGDLARASTYAEQAADQAASALAFDRAAELYANALQWCASRSADPARARSLLLRRARSLSNAGRCAEAAPLYLQAAHDSAPPQQRELRRLAADAYLVAGHLEAGLAVAKPLLAEVGLSYPASPARALLSFGWKLLFLQVRGIDFQARQAPEVAEEELFPVDLSWSLGKGLSQVLPVEGNYFMAQSLLGALTVGEPTRVGRGLAFIGGTVLGSFRRGGAYLGRAEALGRTFEDAYLRGMTLILRAFVNIARAGEWKVVLEQVDQGVELLRSHCTGVSWETTLGTGIGMKALEIMGEIGVFGRRAALWSREAAERGDRFAQVMADQCGILAQIASGDIEGARRQDERVLAAWARGDYTVQHLYSMMLKAFCDLHEGRLDGAWERFWAQWPDIKRSQLLLISITRIPILYLKACLELDRAVERRWERERLLRSCERVAGRLERESRADGQPHATILRAAIAACRRDRARAAALLDASLAAYDRAGMVLSSACVLRRKGELLGDAAVIAEADARIRDLGIASPERWTALYVPRFAV